MPLATGAGNDDPLRNSYIVVAFVPAPAVRGEGRREEERTRANMRGVDGGGMHASLSHSSPKAIIQRASSSTFQFVHNVTPTSL